MKMDQILAITITGLQPYAAGESIEARFRSVTSPQAQQAGCFMATDEDVRFRASVGAVILSYPEGSPERERIDAEMQALRFMGAIFGAAAAGLQVGIGDFPKPPKDPIGLLKLWQERDR